MAMSSKVLAVIQRAGQALDLAREAVAGEVQAQATAVIAQVASQPFSNDSDRAYGRLRSLARIGHELKSLEEQLRGLYAQASELGTVELEQLISISPGAARPLLSQTCDPEDVQVKAPIVASVKPGKRPRVNIQSLHGNDAKVMAYLASALDRRSFKAQTQAVVARGAGIPLGSVGLALRRLIAGGYLTEGDKGHYRLA